MQKSLFNYRTAFILALSISLLMNIISLVMFFYMKNNVIPEHTHHFRPVFRLEITLLNLCFNFIVAYLLYLLNFYFLKSNFFSKNKWLFLVLITFTCTWIISYICSSIQLQFEDFKPDASRYYVGSMVRDSFIAIVVMLSSQLIYLSDKQQQIALENEALLTENMRTRFLALKNQMDPHFLFNSLNTLNSLIKLDADKAQEYVQELSNVFRYTLQNKEVITLEEELKFTMSYCHLMQIRYGESLRFVQHIDERFYSYNIVPLSLQTLVENAIKHNVVSNKQPLTITFSTSDEYILVSNPIQVKKESDRGEGVGLANLEERYRLMWKKNIIVSVTENVFEVSIPLIKQ